ncbi:unnamed protein product [Linum trigynum]|uniref:Uncharacterized protein n=1 Tax=Linum trigynum TaxID=586398 RepID=A0AAV2F7W8_9ROSI
MSSWNIVTCRWLARNAINSSQQETEQSVQVVEDSVSEGVSGVVSVQEAVVINQQGNAQGPEEIEVDRGL